MDSKVYLYGSVLIILCCIYSSKLQCTVQEVSFLEFPQNQSVFLNESVVLRCAIKDIRTVLFFFSFNNEPVHSGSGIHVTYSERGITVMFEATEMFNNSRWRCVFCSTTCPPYFCSESALIKIQGYQITSQPITTTARYQITSQPISTTAIYQATNQPITTTAIYQATNQPITTTAIYQATNQPITTTAIYQATNQPITTTAIYQATNQPITTTANYGTALGISVGAVMIVTVCTVLLTVILILQKVKRNSKDIAKKLKPQRDDMCMLMKDLDKRNEDLEMTEYTTISDAPIPSISKASEAEDDDLPRNEHPEGLEENVKLKPSPKLHAQKPTVKDDEMVQYAALASQPPNAAGKIPFADTAHNKLMIWDNPGIKNEVKSSAQSSYAAGNGSTSVTSASATTQLPPYHSEALMELQAELSSYVNNYDDLAAAVPDPLTLAKAVLSADVITANTFDDVLTSLPENLTLRLLNAIRGHIQEHPIRFHRLLEVLGKDTTLLPTAIAMRCTYTQSCPGVKFSGTFCKELSSSDPHLEWEDCGLSLRVTSTPAIVVVQCASAGSFSSPVDFVFTSPVYLLYLKLLQDTPVRVEALFRHWAADFGGAGLELATCSGPLMVGEYVSGQAPSETPQYVMEITSKRTMTTKYFDKSYSATFILDNSLFVAVVQRKNQPACYEAFLCGPAHPKPGSWNATFSICVSHPVYQTYLLEQLHKLQPTVGWTKLWSHPIQFAKLEDAVELVIPHIPGGYQLKIVGDTRKIPQLLAVLPCTWPTFITDPTMVYPPTIFLEITTPPESIPSKSCTLVVKGTTEEINITLPLSEQTLGTLDPEIQTSRKLVSGKHTREYINIQKTYDLLSRTLVCHVPPNGLANKLFAARLIGEDLRQESNRENIGVTTRINNLLAAMHNQIELNCSVFQKFIEILQNYDQLEEILKILMVGVDTKEKDTTAEK